MSSDPIDSILMNAEWRTCLEASGAVFGTNTVLNFGNPDAERRAAKQGNIIADLSHFAVLRIHGADAQNFLQGQLTNDIRLVDKTRAQLSAYCNAKGRMFAIFLIFQGSDETYYLQLPSALAEPTLKRLRMFVMRSKVNLDINNGDSRRIGLSGPNVESFVSDLLGKTPEKVYDVLTIDDITILRLPGEQSRFELIAPVTSLVSIWQTLSGKAMPVGAGPWTWLDIKAGIPVILPGTVEEFVPQMANLDLVNGVSFSKGCYPGQEIVARMHYLGRLKQRMFRAHVDCSTAPPPGTPIYAPDLPDQSTGHVLVAEAAPEGGVDLLAVVHLTSQAGGVMNLGESDGAKLAIKELPYTLNSSVTT